MKKQLPSRPNLEQLKNQAKDLLKSHRSGDSDAVQRIREFHPRLTSASEGDIRATTLSLSDAQLVVAREYGFDSWPNLKEHVDSDTLEIDDPLELFKEAVIADDAARV